MRFGNPISNVTIAGGTINNLQPQALLGTTSWDIAHDASSVYVLPAGAQSLGLILSLQGGAPVTPCKVTVTGVNSGAVYFNQVIAPNDEMISPVSPVVDPSVVVKCNLQGGLPTNFPLTLYTVARTDPAIVEISGVTPGYETNRYQPVIPSSGSTLSQARSTSVTNGATLLPAIVAPPVYPNQYRIWAISQRGNAAASTTNVAAAVQVSPGGNGELVGFDAFGAGYASVAYGGLILPTAAALLIANSGCTTLVTTVFYDLVSTG